ncbi:MAG: hypothetical protein IMZ57_11000 [Acidobacteria bacterium]|nr:hypothetical protein [Acidobacteriota bacterium]
MNEADAIDFSESDFIDWMKWAIGSVEGLGVPRSKMILTTGRAAAALAAEVGYFSPHGIGRPGDIRAIAGIPIEKTIFSSDGFGQGTGPADESGRPGVGLDVADELAREVLRIGAVSFELLDRGIWRNTPAGGSNNRADLSLSSTAVLDRMTRGR